MIARSTALPGQCWTPFGGGEPMNDMPLQTGASWGDRGTSRHYSLVTDKAWTTRWHVSHAVYCQGMPAEAWAWGGIRHGRGDDSSSQSRAGRCVRAHCSVKRLGASMYSLAGQCANWRNGETICLCDGIIWTELVPIIGADRSARVGRHVGGGRRVLITALWRCLRQAVGSETGIHRRLGGSGQADAALC